MYVYIGQPTLPVIRYIEYSSLSRDPINQKMKVGQIINILPSQSKLYNMKMFNNQKKKLTTRQMRTNESGNALSDRLFWGYFCKYII